MLVVPLAAPFSFLYREVIFVIRISQDDKVRPFLNIYIGRIPVP